jgi:hypothetical protein
MRQEILARLIGGLDFVTLKEVAAECLGRRGYSLVADSDGWSDGGSDLRLYVRNSVDPVKTAIQTSVECRHRRDEAPLPAGSPEPGPSLGLKLAVARFPGEGGARYGS